MRPVILSLAIGALVSALPLQASAHGGQAAQAVVLGPESIGTIVDESYLVRWLDAGFPPPMTGSATVSMFYTSATPPTFRQYEPPQTLTGTVVFTNIKEEDGPDEFLWDTRDVPSGHYWLWSRVDEPPEEISPQLIHFSPVPVTVIHPGDEDRVGPAAAVIVPATPFAWSDKMFEVKFATWDPTGTSRVMVEATQLGGDGRYIRIGDNLRALPENTVQWNTEGLPQGDWIIRVTITDCEGRAYSAFGRFFLLVNHLDETDGGIPDANILDDSGSLEEWCESVTAIDSGTIDAQTVPDAGQVDSGSELPEPEGCSCASAGAPAGSAALGLLGCVLAIAVLRRRLR